MEEGKSGGSGTRIGIVAKAMCWRKDGAGSWKKRIWKPVTLLASWNRPDKTNSFTLNGRHERLLLQPGPLSTRFRPLDCLELTLSKLRRIVGVVRREGESWNFSLYNVPKNKGLSEHCNVHIFPFFFLSFFSILHVNFLMKNEMEMIPKKDN